MNMNLRPLSLLFVLLTFAGCKAAEPHDASADMDPWVGIYSVFMGGDGRFIELPGPQSPITITREGEGYRCDYEPGLLFVQREPNVLVSDDSRAATLTRAVLEDTGHRVIELNRNLFAPHLTLVEGVGPATWPGLAELNRGQWTYERHVTSPGSRSERVYGELRYRGELIPAQPGTIIFTPVGKFMFFGEGPPHGPQFDYNCGWLSATTYDYAVFNDDGSLTEEGSAYRASILGAEQTSATPAWPDTITYDRLDLSDRDTLRTQSYALPRNGLTNVLCDTSQTLTHHYPGIQGPTGHGSFLGTTVYYVPVDNQFYFQSDCGQGHYDGYIGPFESDPRVVLRP